MQYFAFGTTPDVIKSLKPRFFFSDFTKMHYGTLAHNLIEIQRNSDVSSKVLKIDSQLGFTSAENLECGRSAYCIQSRFPLKYSNIRDHSFSTHVNFFEKLTFLTPCRVLTSTYE